MVLGGRWKGPGDPWPTPGRAAAFWLLACYFLASGKGMAQVLPCCKALWHWGQHSLRRPLVVAHPQLVGKGQHL